MVMTAAPLRHGFWRPFAHADGGFSFTNGSPLLIGFTLSLVLSPPIKVGSSRFLSAPAISEKKKRRSPRTWRKLCPPRIGFFSLALVTIQRTLPHSVSTSARHTAT